MKQVSRKKGVVNTIKKSLVKEVEQLSDDQVRYDTYMDNGQASQLSMKQQLHQIENQKQQDQSQYNTVELESQQFMPKSNIDTFYDSEIMNEIQREIYADQGSFVQDQTIQSNLKKTKQNPSKSTNHEDSYDLTSTDIEKYQQKANKNKNLQNSRLKKEELKRLQQKRILEQKSRILQEKQRVLQQKVRLLQQKQQKNKELQQKSQKARLLQQKLKSSIEQKKKPAQKKPQPLKKPHPGHSQSSSQQPLQIPQIKKRPQPTAQSSLQTSSIPLKKSKPNNQSTKININPIIKIRLLKMGLNVCRIVKEDKDGFMVQNQQKEMFRLGEVEVMWFYKDLLVDYYRKQGKNMFK